MGSYSTLYLNNFELYSLKWDIDPTVMMLFTENDKHIRPYTDEELKRDFGIASPEENEDFDIPVNTIEYTTSISIAKDRLEFMGFTMSKVHKVFKDEVKNRLESLFIRREDTSWKENERLHSINEREIEILQSLTFDTWAKEFTNILCQNITGIYEYWWDDNTEELSLLAKYMLCRGNDDWLFGFPSLDYRIFIRAVAEIADSNTSVSYDLTQLTESDSFDPNEDFCLSARWSLAEDFVINHKIIVLTEGASDKWVLERSLKLLYPHLAEYYSFMDFEGAKVQGGAGSLVSTVKAFIGSGVVNRIIAIFDNDTAAKSAIRSLQNIQIPPNIKILQYPDIEIAENYPTLGPQGTTKMNVNGLAGSLEMYFGNDVLLMEDGDLTPIQWRGYDSALSQYQGEILNKTSIQSKFNEMLKSCELNSALIDKFDWSGIKVIINCLKLAFCED